MKMYVKKFGLAQYSYNRLIMITLLHFT